MLCTISWCSKEGAWGRGRQENKTASLRDISWCEDVRLQDDLRNYVRQNLKRKEMLDFLRRDFPTYAWRIPTLDRRLRYFNIFYRDTNVTLDKVKESVGKGLEGPGKLLRYRALHQKNLARAPFKCAARSGIYSCGVCYKSNVGGTALYFTK